MCYRFFLIISNCFGFVKQKKLFFFYYNRLFKQFFYWTFINNIQLHHFLLNKTKQIVFFFNYNRFVKKDFNRLLGRMSWPGFELWYLHLCVWVYNDFVISSIYQQFIFLFNIDINIVLKFMIVSSRTYNQILWLSHLI